MDDGVGNKLREARTRRKLTLQEVEAATKIRARYLQAIETEDWDQLPGDTYARAFIRTYGALLGLDGDRLAEDQRRGRGAARPGERLPRVDPRPRRVMRKRRSGPRVPSGLVAALVTALVVVALLVVGLTAGDSGDSGPGSEARPAGSGKNTDADQRQAPQPAAEGHTLRLLANGEVWVCLLSGKGKPLVGGDILAPGETAGPFRSGSFTVALGNGAVTMTVDGKQLSLPEPPSPIGFAVSPRGAVSELPEGERPTCT
ncbi:MAG TPA: helix-turn-helix domain-containing protein [Solirubrobacterales bacterium]|nr:helix-turn-helix domain-containing protein [Solirubrobacterales bacterium]